MWRIFRDEFGAYARFVKPTVNGRPMGERKVIPTLLCVAPHYARDSSSLRRVATRRPALPCFDFDAASSLMNAWNAAPLDRFGDGCVMISRCAFQVFAEPGDARRA
jgi:hypothetical protein